MEVDVPGTDRPASPSDPLDRSGTTVPEHIAFVLHAIGILLGFGRHLLETVRHRAAAPNFTTIAACFGTSNLSTILAHLNRGILRAMALERVLLARAATGRDIVIPTPRVRTAETRPVPADAQPAEPPPTRKIAPRPSLPPGQNDPELFMPTPEELEREIRRRPLGRTIIAICLDLAVMPGLCTGPFWNELLAIIQCLRGSLGTLMKEKMRRERAIALEQDRIPGSDWNWMHFKRDDIRQVLGFFIGETPVDPFAPTAAAATGPP
jgi:hypothetical protein